MASETCGFDCELAVGRGNCFEGKPSIVVRHGAKCGGRAVVKETRADDSHSALVAHDA